MAPAQTAGANGAGTVRAPMAGLVLKVAVTAGQQVEAGADLMVLEAMKMENNIKAPVGGVIESISVQPQQTVNQGDLLVTIA